MQIELTEQDYLDTAKELNCEPAVIKAVVEVESSGSGFLPSGEPKILYEPHIFSKLTNHKYDKTHPSLSYRKWGTLPYGPVSVQHSKLASAVKLDREAALQSCSWGLFQIMGFNYKACGYGSVQELVNDAYRGIQGHLRMFLGFVKSEGLVDELQRKDWAGFARKYNGPGYAINDYHRKILLKEKAP